MNHCTAFVLSLLLLTPAFGQSGDPLPLKGPVVLSFDRELTALGLPDSQFGVFRNDDPPQVQHIEQMWRRIRLPGQRLGTGFLVVPYNVSGTGSYNGWWVKLGDANWNAYRDGELILRLRRLPLNRNEFERTVKLRRPDTVCTTKFKVELKTKTAGGHQRVVGLRQYVYQKHGNQQSREGYFDMRIPLSNFSLDLTRVHELVLVFENMQIERSQRQGALGIQSIVLSPARNGAVADVLHSPDRLLDELEWKAFKWFREHRHPTTGLVLDRGKNFAPQPPKPDQPAMASIASVGYYLSLLPEYVRLGRLSRDAATQQAERTLAFVLKNVEHHEGLMYHFVDWRSGKRWDRCEVSTLDTAILLNGCMVAAEAFGGEVAAVADKLLDRANWPKYLVEHATTGKQLLSLGWTPEQGLLGPADVRSSEMAIPYFLAAGSKHSIDAQCWYNTTVSYGKIHGHRILNKHHPLFTSYFGLGWHDLKGKVDRERVDLDGNARAAALANRKFCRKEGERYGTYAFSKGGWWGISAGDAPTGYIAPGPIKSDADGIVWPTTALAAMPWVASEMRDDLSRWHRSRAWKLVSGEFGLAPFRHAPKREWTGDDLIGIDLGSFAVSLANHRNRTVWDLWMRHPVAQAGLTKLRYTDAK